MAVFTIYCNVFLDKKKIVYDNVVLKDPNIRIGGTSYSSHIPKKEQVKVIECLVHWNKKESLTSNLKDQKMCVSYALKYFSEVF